ncbi:hypothetical protein GCM10010112_78550 [Actinoplanes lobatus]|uniref:Integral membrane protein n=1 Tax=Actinoplanes lobatus TaxID=113568 RepID=A0A7W7HMX0_9ACTN|nr:hypothetical protein [Actinoplanes lobatus]MBB4753477.1 hypothetical protein [Actinoplanes lobatus]GGN91909.1 hypothetical protein GCM10010112_78550 [Actinoplanes lobatus]GIE38011.1 hypothetical protein Alo02nite_09090 [Actinoplanes lobatus]
MPEVRVVSTVLHAMAVVIFGLLAWSGADGIRSGVPELGVPMLIAGVAGSVGALVILSSVLRRRHGTADQRAARIGMAVAAVVTVVVGVALAPAGWERGFVIAVNAGVGFLLAVFAALAGK